MPRSSLDELHATLSNAQQRLEQRRKATGSPYSNNRAGSISRVWHRRGIQQPSCADYCRDGDTAPSVNSLAAATKTLPRMLTTIGSRAVASSQKRPSSSLLQSLLPLVTATQSSSSGGWRLAEKAYSACTLRRNDCPVEIGTTRRRCKGCRQRKVKCDHASAPTIRMSSPSISESEDGEDDNSQNGKSSYGSNIQLERQGRRLVRYYRRQLDLRPLSLP